MQKSAIVILLDVFPHQILYIDENKFLVELL